VLNLVVGSEIVKCISYKNTSERSETGAGMYWTWGNCLLCCWGSE